MTRLRKERTKLATVKIILAATRLESLDILITSWEGASEDVRAPGKPKDITKPEPTAINFKKIVPSLACIPHINDGRNISREFAVPWMKASERLFFHINKLVERKLQLEVSDVQWLGREASLESHEIHFFSDWLQEEQMAEDIVSRWNERYS